MSPRFVEVVALHARLRQDEKLTVPPIMQAAARFVQHAGSILPRLVTKDAAHRLGLQAAQVGSGQEQGHVREEDLHLALLVPILRQQGSRFWRVADRVVHARLCPVLQVIIRLTNQQRRTRVFCDDVLQRGLHERRLAGANRCQYHDLLRVGVRHHVERLDLPRRVRG